MSHGNTVAPAEQFSFADFLAKLQQGLFLDDCTDALREVVTHMQQVERATGGAPKGKLTISFDFKLSGGVFEGLGDITVKRPKLVRHRSIFYATPDGRLSVNDPRQLDLGVAPRDVSTQPELSPARALRVTP